MQPFSIHASCARYPIAGSYLLSLLHSTFFFVFPLLCCSHNSCSHAEMWPNQHWTSGDPLQGPYADSDDEEFRVLAAPLLTTGSVTQAPQNLTDYSINLSELMTRPETIIESQGLNAGMGICLNFLTCLFTNLPIPAAVLHLISNPRHLPLCIVLVLYLLHQTLFLTNLSRLMAYFFNK